MFSQGIFSFQIFWLKVCNISLTPLSTLHSSHPTNLITLIMFRKVKANLCQCWTQHHIKDVQCRGKDDIQEFFISTLSGDEWLASRPGSFATGKGAPWYEILQRVLAAKNVFTWFREDINILPL